MPTATARPIPEVAPVTTRTFSSAILRDALQIDRRYFNGIDVVETRQIGFAMVRPQSTDH
jgi:hypothetical protein